MSRLVFMIVWNVWSINPIILRLDMQGAWVISVSHSRWIKVKPLPERERLRLRELPHPAHSENLDQVVRVQSSLQATRHSLIWGGRGPAHRRHSVILADSPLSSTQLTPVNTEGRRDCHSNYTRQCTRSGSHLTKLSHPVQLSPVLFEFSLQIRSWSSVLE